MNTNFPARRRSAHRPLTGRGQRAAFVMSSVIVLTLTPVLVTSAGASPATPSRTSAPALANTLPGDPGNPQPGAVFFEEEFNNLGGSATRLASYGSLSLGQTFNADAQYLTTGVRCNGWVRNYASPYTSAESSKGCSGGNWDMLRDITETINTFRGLPSTGGNGVLAEGTVGSMTSGTVVQTVTPMAATGGHHYAISAVVGAKNCDTAHPNLAFDLLVDGVASQVSSGFDPCTAAGGVDGPIASWHARAAQMMSTAARVPVAGTPTLGFRVRNLAAGDPGNDFALDDVRIIDVTPQMDVAFTPTGVAINPTTGISASSTLQFTITNTSELSAKPAWSFVDKLPAGLTFAVPDGATTTCGPGSSVVTDPLAGTVTASGGLADTKASCTMSVGVTGDTAGKYTTDAANITSSTGLNPPGSASLTVLPPPNRPPVPDPVTIAVYKGTSVPVTLTGSDPDGGPLTCTTSVSTTQLKGTLGGAGCNRTFTADPGTSGTDSFSFRMTDNKGLQSGSATVTLKIVNRAPVATDQTITVDPSQSVAVTLAGTDLDPGEAAALTCAPKLGATALGKVTGSGCAVTYTAGTKGGSDSFTFTVNDGFGGVATGTVHVTIGPPPNQAPTATPLTASATKGQPVTLSLSGTDPEGGPLTCLVPATTAQGKGTIGGTGCDRTFTPDSRTTGTDSFTFRVVDDKGLQSAPVTVTLTITNRVPVATDQTVTVGRGERVALTLAGSDPDPGETLTLGCTPKLGATSLGAVTGSGCFVTYTAGDANGGDSFTFTVSDGLGGVSTGTVHVTVVDPVLPGCSARDSKNARYVCKVYLDLLGRGADPSGKEFWLRKVDNGESRALIIRKYQTTPEYRRRAVDDVYKTFLRRNPSTTDQTYWVDKLGTGTNPDDIRAQVLGGSEFYAKAGGAPEEFAAALYQQVTRVPATVSETSSVVDQLAAGTSRSAIAAALLATKAGDTATVQGIYARYLRRAAPSSEVTYWVTKLQSGVTELKIVEATVSSNEYYTHA